MIYLVSSNKLLTSTKYKIISFSESLKYLPKDEVQLDTETSKLDCFTGKLLTLQLGTKENQIVYDWSTLSKNNIQALKEYLESGILVIIQNAMFDLQFLYYYNIWPKKIYDTMIVEQLIHLGLPKSIPMLQYNYLGLNLPQYTFKENLENYEKSTYELKFGLNYISKRYLGIEIDKSVRGKIKTVGLTEEVVVYAGNDVAWLQDIKAKQEEELIKQDLTKAALLENEAVKGVAYIKFCGMHLDADKWKAKMKINQEIHDSAKTELDNYVINLFLNKGFDPYTNTYNEEVIVDTKWIHPHEKDWKFPNPDQLIAKLGKSSKIVKRYTTKEDNPKYIEVRTAKCKYVEVNLNGNLFTGYDTSPKCTINWSSPAQVIDFFEYLGMNLEVWDKKTNSKKKSIKENVVSKYLKEYPIVEVYLRYKGAAKEISSFGDNWLQGINPKTGRVHVDLHVVGTDTSRLSSGGGEYNLNQQQLPHDKETRACFTAEKGNLWFSCDYTAQESAITASVSNDKTMIEILESGRDLHCEVARVSWPDVLDGKSDSDIKINYKPYRNDAKGVEFGIYYGGDANTLVDTKGFSRSEANKIYLNFMNRFSGLRDYQDYCRKAVMKLGYITMNSNYKHRAHIYDFEWLKSIEKKFCKEFWDEYNYLKRYDPNNRLVADVKLYYKRKAEIERASINYRIQNRGSCCFKLSLIKLFNWIVSNNLQNIVKIVVGAHDEINLEAPIELEDTVSTILVTAMEAGAKPFCTRVKLSADLSVGPHWIH